MLLVLMHFFNENIKLPNYKLHLQRINTIHSGLVISESFIGSRYHLDLKLVREDKSR
jgi:hypothetical protein